MVLDRGRKEATMKEFMLHETDTGSASVQIALLTEKIKSLAAHLETHKKDQSSRRGLLTMVSKRRKFLDYLKAKDEKLYRDVISSLNLRR